MRVILTNDEGREFDITEHFRVLYDNVVGSMDWGSGFLDGNDALTVMQAGVAAGFDVTIDGAAPENLVNAFPRMGQGFHTSAGAYYQFKSERKQWIRENLGDPLTWDSIEQYREKLSEMENDQDV